MLSRAFIRTVPRCTPAVRRLAVVGAQPVQRSWNPALVVGASVLAAGALYASMPKTVQAGGIPHYGVPGTKQERTFIAVKVWATLTSARRRAAWNRW